MEGEKVIRHSWQKINEDLRRSVQEPIPILHRCTQCGVYRITYGQFVGENWRTRYGVPYSGKFTRFAPPCAPRI